jgi:PTH1 family peptidyl-tRNA hydrolase
MDRAKFRSLYGEAVFGGKKTLFLKPQTFMNLSGQSVAPLVKYHNVDPRDLVVIQDDIDLGVGRLRIRKDGSHGGHNGIRNIIEQLGTANFSRVKVGVGKDKANVVGHVLGKLALNERVILEKVFEVAVKAIEKIVAEGPDAAMNEFNGVRISDCE